jgi:murein DD-endopeptidase MepM/ murein hydrolase activator NlpD
VTPGNDNGDPTLDPVFPGELVFPVLEVPGAEPDPHPTRPGRRCRTKPTIDGDWHAARRGNHYHRGQDIFADSGSPIVAPVAGKVVTSTWGDNGGWQVSIRDVDGNRWLMSHMLEQPLVRLGDRVAAGATIGKVGNSGQASHACPHLHIHATREDGKRWNLYAALRRAQEGAPSSTFPPGGIHA